MRLEMDIRVGAPPGIREPPVAVPQTGGQKAPASPAPMDDLVLLGQAAVAALELEMLRSFQNPGPSAVNLRPPQEPRPAERAVAEAQIPTAPDRPTIAIIDPGFKAHVLRSYDASAQGLEAAEPAGASTGRGVLRPAEVDAPPGEKDGGKPTHSSVEASIGTEARPAPVQVIEPAIERGVMSRCPHTGLRRSVVASVMRALWRRLPLLAILVVWLLAGAVAGTISLPFRNGQIDAFRQALFPIWAMTALGIVVLGFVRSALRLFRGN